MRLLGSALLALALFVGCDAGDPSNSDDPPSVPGQDSSVSRVVFVRDTIDSNAATITVVQRKLLISGTDTSILQAWDTLRLINGTALDTGISHQAPCKSGLTIYNAYGTEITLELWVGQGLSYQNGMIRGSYLDRIGLHPSLPADLDHNQWCTGWNGFASSEDLSLLVVAGVPVEPGVSTSYFLAEGLFPAADAQAILVVDELGRLRQLR